MKLCLYVGWNLEPIDVNKVPHVQQKKQDCGQIHFHEHAFDA
jgi:hypothetical protein